MEVRRGLLAGKALSDAGDATTPRIRGRVLPACDLQVSPVVDVAP